MYTNESRPTSPLQDLFKDVEKILSYMETKNSNEANKYETTEIRDSAEMWIAAKMEDDTYLTYKPYWTIAMFKEVLPTSRYVDIQNWINNPYNVPIDFRDHLLKCGRQAFLDEYEEKNDYYRMLNGLPPYETNKSDFLYLSEDMQNKLHATNDPIHMLSPLIQNNFMSTEEYTNLVADNPDKPYLKYLGIYKIDPFVARRAKDFDIIRYPLDRYDINPNLINTFASLYADYREYVMVTLYNSYLEGIYENYRTFMGVLIISFTLLQINNVGLELSKSRNFLDDSAIHTILSMYGIPDELLLTNEIRRNLVTNLPRLISNKGMDEVYYELVNILGYSNVSFSKLLLMKGQQFDPNENNKATTDNNPYFVQVALNDTNPYQTISEGRSPIHNYSDIVSGDPRWWDLPDTRKILSDSSYTISDTKYLVIESAVNNAKYLLESIYFPRMIFDNKEFTNNFMIEIPEIFGTMTVSVYDVMLFIICAACMNENVPGTIITDEKELLAISGFNFDLNFDTFMEYINNSKYLDKDRINSFIKDISVRIPSDLNRIFHDVMYPMREWLERKIANSVNRAEHTEYENVYKAMFTYDINRNTFLSDFELPLEQIRKTYNISAEDMLAFKSFYPHKMSGDTIKVAEYNASNNITQYRYPFLLHNKEIPWWLHIVIDTPYGLDDRGYLYMYDILNHPNLKEITNENNLRIFMDYEDEEIGWQINQQAVDKAIELIDALDEDALQTAFFQVYTPIRNGNGKSYAANELLPPSIRSGSYKSILKEKLLLDLDGYAVPPKTYLEYLYRKNFKLYEVLTKDDRINRDKQAWMDDVLSIILTIETQLNIHMKYLEQSVVGSESFFKPLITLINRFKSTMVDIAKVNLNYVFEDKIDTGGNSNLLKLFDEVWATLRFVIFDNSDHDASLKLFDTEHQMKYHVLIKDKSLIHTTTIGTGFVAETKSIKMNSMAISDEAKFRLNGKDIDPDRRPSYWISGDPGTGRWEQDDDFYTRSRKYEEHITNIPYDYDAWQYYVESYNQI